MQDQIILLALAVAIAWPIFGTAHRTGDGLARNLNAYLNRRVYENTLRKAQGLGIEKEFRDAFLSYGGLQDFAWQRPGLAWHALRIAETWAKNTSKSA